MGPDHAVPRRDGPLSVPELREEVAAGRVRSVRLALTDAQGRLKGKLHDSGHFLDHVLGEGAEMCSYTLATDVDMRPLDGFALTSWDSGYQDLRLVPDLATIRLTPWTPGTAVVYADAVTHRGEPVEVSPRRLLRRRLEALERVGLGVKVGLETEFVVYEGGHCDAAAAGYQGLRPVACDNLDYALDHAPRQEQYLHDLAAALAGAGLPVEALKTESAPGQVEVTFPYGEALPACDGHVLFKHAARTVGACRGLSPTFMAAPQTGVASGLHLHVSLWRGGRSALVDADDRPAPEAGHAVAGLLAALPGLAPLYAPNTNSYKRFVRDSFAPTRMTWGVDNRTCAVRVVGHGQGLHLEVRLPGADANPYLALAAVLAAVQHGLDGAMPPPEPHPGNAYLAGDAPAVPEGLEIALEAFRKSAVAREAFGDGVVEHYAHLGDIEAEALRGEVTDAERRRWFARA